MPNDFSKQEIVAFEEAGLGFDDALVMSKTIKKYDTDQTTMERTGDVIWRPMKIVMQSHDGSDATGDFDDVTELSVPATIGYDKHASWPMSSTEMRDASKEGKIQTAAKQTLASQINVAALAVAGTGSLTVKRTVAATGFDDIALCDSLMNENGVPMDYRYIALSSRNYNAMAGNLASRATVSGKVQTAYERALVGEGIAGFDVLKLDYAGRLAAAGGVALTIGTRVADAMYYTPKAVSVATTGEKSNVDNRYQRVTWSDTTGAAAGDRFTITGVNSVHPITKVDTGQLKTFRVVSVDDGTHVTITPPIISAQGGTDAELQYQNCVVNTAAANSLIVFLNTVAADLNPFWYRDSIEILPGRLAIEPNGVAVRRMTTESGLELVMQKQYDIMTRKTYIRIDTIFGLVNLNTEMNGVMLFSQT
jgi:hypothetical protein